MWVKKGEKVESKEKPEVQKDHGSDAGAFLKF
jgi:hypothetical protein